MTLTEALPFLGAVVAILGVVLPLHFGNIRRMESAAVERGKIAAKVDALWQFHLDRAAIAAEKKGYGSTNSPFVVSAAGRATVSSSFRTALQSFYWTLDRSVRDDDVLLTQAIVGRFRHELIEKLCRPFGMDNGECLLIAMAAARTQ